MSRVIKDYLESALPRSLIGFIINLNPTEGAAKSDCADFEGF